jgi:hypothetical protein
MNKEPRTKDVANLSQCSVGPDFLPVMGLVDGKRARGREPRSVDFGATNSLNRSPDSGAEQVVLMRCSSINERS